MSTTPTGQTTTPRTRDDRKQELLQTIGLLSERAVSELAALMSALLDSQAGLLLARDEKSLRAAIARLHATGDTGPIDRWLRRHGYLPLTDSPHTQRNRAQGGRDGE